MKPNNWFILKKKVRFGDCDSAGVIHFHNLLRWAHERWEESIDIYGIPCQDIFPDLSSTKSHIIFPIVNCEANFFSPIKIGDFLKIKISLEIADPADIDTVNQLLPRIVDNFQVYLRELRVQELQGSAGMYRLHEELLRRVNIAVRPAKVKDVLFKEMLVQ